jgi:hypothetical protein
MTEEKKENSISLDESKLAKDLLKIIAISDIRLGDRDVAKEPEKYKEVAQKMIQLLFKKNVREQEVELLFQLMRQAISIAQNAIVGSLELSKNIALTNYWGKHPMEITLQDIDNKMKKDK